MTIRGVILDIDGTLLSSNDAHARAWVRAFGDEGLDVSYDRVRPLIGMGGDQLVPRLGIPEDTARFERLKEGWKAHFQEELPTLAPTNGARDLVSGLHERGLRVIYGTSADESLLQDMLKQATLNDLGVPATTASDVEASKPRPDIVLAALTKLGLKERDVLMIGDTPYDVQAASNAGVRTVFVRTGGFDDPEDALACFDDPAAVLAHLDDVLTR